MPSAARRWGGFGVSWKSGPDQPIGRSPVAFSTAAIEARMYWRSSSSDMPMWMIWLRVMLCEMNCVALLALVDLDGVVIGDDLIESPCARDAILVQRSQNSTDPSPIAIFMVAVAAEIRKGRLVAGPQALWAAQCAHGQRSTRRNRQSQCSGFTMTAKARRALSGHFRARRAMIGDRG